MFYLEPANIVRDLQDQSVDIRKRPLVAADFAYDKGANAPETGEIKTLWLFEYEIGDAVGEATPELRQTECCFSS